MVELELEFRPFAFQNAFSKDCRAKSESLQGEELMLELGAAQDARQGSEREGGVLWKQTDPTLNFGSVASLAAA